MMRPVLIAMLLLLALLGQGVGAMPAMGAACADGARQESGLPACEHAGCLEHGQCTDCTTGSCLAWAVPTRHVPAMQLPSHRPQRPARADRAPAAAPAQVYRPPRPLSA